MMRSAPRPSDTPTAALQATVQGGATLNWLIGIFLLCLLLVFGLRGYFTALEADIGQQGASEISLQMAGDALVRDVQGLERELYQLALAPNADDFTALRASIRTRLERARHTLGVLEQAGSSQPEAATPSSSLATDLDQLQNHVQVLSQQLPLRWQSLASADARTLLLTEQAMAAALKPLAPLFDELNTQAKQVALAGEQRLIARQTELQHRATKLQSIETGLVIFVVLLGGTSGIALMRHLSAALKNAQEAGLAIARQREQNATILNTLSDGVYSTNMQGEVTFINAAGERILGWPAADLVGQAAHSCLHHSHPDGTPYAREHCPLLEALHTGAALDAEEYFVTRSGTFLPVAYRSKPLTHDGVAVGALVSFHDISERLQSQAHIRLQQAALDAAANMIVITDHQGIINYVNPAFCHATGYSTQEAVGAHSRILNSDHHDATFYQQMWLTLVQGKPWEGEIYNRRKNGEVYPEQMTITPIVENGVVAHFVAIKRDITQDLATRTRLKLVESAIQDIEQGIFIADAQAHAMGPTIAYVNAGFCRMLAFGSDEATGVRVGSLCSPDTDPAKLTQMQTSMTQGDSLMLEMSLQRKDGAPLPTELYLSPVRNEQAEVTHYIGVLTDISLRQKTELALRDARDQALENSRLKSEFLSNMSHEIRTPMNGIIGMTGLLLDTRLDPEQRDFTQIVRDSAQALLVIINDILDFSKIEAGKLDVEITDFSPLEVVEGTTELLLAKAREKSLWLTSFVDPGIPALMRGDPTRLRQVMLNLISNAVKFTEQGGIELTAHTVARDGQPMVRFEVRDTGIGISPAVQARLFTSFTQADSSTTRKYGGTGLGLAISRSLVELMGGQIGIQSQLGEGSTFWFTLPLQLSNPSAETPLAAALAAEPAGMRVLVVDDQAIDRKIIGRYLDSWRMVSQSAPNAEQGLTLLADALARGQPFDAALIDLVMPGRDGLELARTLRADRRFDALRLVLLTGHDRRNLAEQATQAGFFACLSKPVRQSQLLDSLTVQADMPAPALPAARPASTPVSPQAQPYRILLAEDNLINQKVAQLQVGKLGYTLHTVNNGQDAVAAMAAVNAGLSAPYAAILMDCQMPVMDGFEATAVIRQAQLQDGSRTPIIAMTANAMQGDRERCLVAGMDDYISKPIDPVQLREVLLRWVAITPGRTPVPAKPAPTPALSNEVYHQTLINFDLLQDYFGDEPETIGRLLKLFEVTSGVLLKKLSRAAEQHDADNVCALAHELKGSCGNIGVERMAYIANDLETAAQALRWDEVDSLRQVLTEAFKATLAARSAV